MISALDEIDSTVAAARGGARTTCPSRSTRFCCAHASTRVSKKAGLRDGSAPITEELRAKQEASEALLLNILARRTSSAPAASEEPSSRTASMDATILFADSCDFLLAPGRRRERTVELLGGLIAEFAALADPAGLEKIKTTATVYGRRRACPLPEPRPDHARAVAKMALARREAAATGAAGSRKTPQCASGA